MPDAERGASDETASRAYERVRLLGTKSAELVVLRWTPFVASAVHDHGGGRGLVLLVRGTLRERFYARGTTEPVVLSEHIHHAPALVRVARDSLHTMESVGDVPARSVHLYRDATTFMRVFDPARGAFVPVREGTGAHLPVDDTTVVDDEP